MDVCLPLPHFETKGLEDGQRQHHEGAADNTDVDSLSMRFVHMADKGNIILLIHQTIYHFSAISSHICVHLSHTDAEYPRYLDDYVVVCTFATSNK